MIQDILKTAIKSASGVDGFSLEHPQEEKFGDWATNVALKLNQGSPMDSADKLVDKLKTDKQLEEIVESIDAVKPGFINFKLKPSFYLDLVRKIATEGNYGAGEWGEGKKVLVEYSSPNIAKRFSAGHLRSTIIGDAIKRLYEFAGWQVITDNHLGDWGTQFGMIIAAMEEKNLDVLTMSVADLEDLYVDFNKRLETEPELRDKARDAFARLENGDKKAREIWHQAKDISLKEFEVIYKTLGVTFSHAYGEADYEETMKEIIPTIKEKIGRESEGAVIVEFEGMPPAMLVKSNGTTTYFTRDMATVKFRQDTPDLKSDLYVYEVGAEQTLHFRQVFAAAEKMGWAKRDQFVHVAHGLMTLSEGKMSTRKGNTIKLEELLAEAKHRSTLLGSVDEATNQAIAVGAVKYNELRHLPTSNYVFVWDEALNMEGDSGPYLQYAGVRATNVLKEPEKLLDVPQTYNFNDEELTLIRWLSRFPEITEVAARQFSPNLLCSYLFESAQRFNSFYNQHRILQASTDDEKALRLNLTEAFACVLRTGLNLLGITTVKKM